METPRRSTWYLIHILLNSCTVSWDNVLNNVASLGLLTGENHLAMADSKGSRTSGGQSDDQNYAGTPPRTFSQASLDSHGRPFRGSSVGSGDVLAPPEPLALTAQREDEKIDLERAIHSRMMLEDQLVQFQLQNERLEKEKEDLERHTGAQLMQTEEELQRTREEAQEAVDQYKMLLDEKHERMRELEDEVEKLLEQLGRVHEEQAGKLGRLDPKATHLVSVPKKVEPIDAVIRTQNPSLVYMSLGKRTRRRSRVRAVG